jgi:ZIP family zinc transporter
VSVRNTSADADGAWPSRLGLAATAALIALSAWGVGAGRAKLVGIGWAAFAAMALAAPAGALTAPERDARRLVWGYGLASGAMVTGAAVFLLPQAIGVASAPGYGGAGVALGLLAGYAGHTVGHRLAHVDVGLDRTVAELTAHAFAAGTVIGVVYGAMPGLGPTLGLAIVSHKAPAGYAAAARLAGRDRGWTSLLLPAAGVGVAGLLASAVALPVAGAARGVVFGFAAGVFLHVAMDFLPRCEIGSEIHERLEVDGDAHAVLDRLRLRAVVSTAAGGAAVALAWLVVG